jgi:hypothetical protein
MKTTVSLTLALAASFLLNGCHRQPPSASPAPEKRMVSAERTSFQQVTEQLDPGGNLYVYLSTEQCLEGLSAKVAGWRGLLAGIPDMKDADRDNLNKVFDVVTNLIKDSGLEDISGFGMSSIAVEKGMYHAKTVLHHYPGRGGGFAWNLFGEKAHALDGLDLLPTNTALASFSDVDVALCWSVLQKEAAKSGFPQAEAFLNKLPEGFEKATGVKWDRLVASLGNEFGVVLTLNDSKTISIPIPGADGPLEMPEPALMLIAKVKDDTLFQCIDSALTNSPLPAVRTDKPDRKLRTVAVPLPVPIELRPTVATSGGYLFLASSDGIIQEALAVKAGQKPGLISTEEFKYLSGDLPQQGNHFSFVSRRLGQAFARLQQRGLQIAAKSAPGKTEWLQSVFASNNSTFGYGVGMNTDQGWIAVANGTQNPGKMLALAVAVPAAAVGSAVALPALAKAKARASHPATGQ